jgi:hypothetical protein
MSMYDLPGHYHETEDLIMMDQDRRDEDARLKRALALLDYLQRYDVLALRYYEALMKYAPYRRVQFPTWDAPVSVDDGDEIPF